VKFLLVPFLIIGMFVSFGAALISMLFFTHTITSVDQLKGVLPGAQDTTRLADEFVLKEDKLDRLFSMAEEYKRLYETERKRATELQDSLVTEEARFLARRDSLAGVEQVLRAETDSTQKARREQNLKEVVTFYNKLKPSAAADILQQEGQLGDTTVALIMKNLQPAHMAKIMGFMNPEFAARITKLLQSL
jgi:flagellar motility protein MotE (MotC chaperone)